ncbi:hypothetical protein [Streptomyces halstedii]|uniref:Uncharacterized protein n=1 Tax=Streptomyces halstedii TaxID=1944 RepID=A0A6N9U8F0_STRHA|nr:hypothetical protein [Streptomyces halstedii]NEA19837.1 hypothetical protein [Streptomyces halstedii]
MITEPRRYGRTNAARAEADRLAAQGHHVHYHAEGYTTCRSGHCTREAQR